MLTPQQAQTLKADLAANTATLNGIPIKDLPHNSDTAFDVASWYSQTAAPAFTVWRTEANARQLMGDPGFDWTRVDNLSVGKARIWEFMMMGGTIDPSQPNIRNGFAACFSAVGDAATLAAILGRCKRPATRIEKLLATGEGSVAVPATMGFEGAILGSDILTAWNS